VGVWVFSAAPASELVEAVVVADRRGIDDVWMADEGVPREPVPVLSFAAARTSRVRLGLGITSPFLRHPGAIGSTVSTLDELSEGRAMLGLGVGGNLSLDPFGVTPERPVAAMRDAIRISRGVIARTACEGYEPPGHAGPGRDVPIFVGARGEQMNRLASRDADGVFLSGFELARLAEPIAWARSVRPIHVGLYASVRFRPESPPDPTALAGPPAAVADDLLDLIERFQPDSIGLALVDGDPTVAMMERAADVFDRVR
jgi:5,10-methylenetetrahydromethanopterin reductase